MQSIDPLVRDHPCEELVVAYIMGGGLLRLPREVRTHSLLKGIKRMFSWENVLHLFNFLVTLY